MSTTARKISVSIDPEALAWVVQKAKRERRSLSAVIAAAVQMERQAEGARRLVEHLGVDATDAEVGALFRAWNEPPPPAKKSSGRRRS